MRDTIDVAREAGGDDWDLFKDFMPEIERLVALVRADQCEIDARIVEESSLPDSYSEACLPEIAAFIRARGENT